MKKSTLALSVAAAIGGLGFVSNALAIGDITGATATTLVKNASGIGHVLLVPYFTAQSDNATMINITNTDMVNGKAVKVRFRGAGNSDDLYDFTLLLSPGDSWGAAVTKDVATGLAKLATSDKSCVVPAVAKASSFSTLRADSLLTGDALANQTREGYIEILTMADIPKSLVVGSLYDLIKHKKITTPNTGTPDCTDANLLPIIGTDFATNAAAKAAGLSEPTTGLTGDWIILNQLNTAAWSGAATALEARGGTGKGNLVFWPQADTLLTGNPTVSSTGGALADISAAALGNATADPLLLSGVVAIKNYDLPDLSTPYVNAVLASATDANASLRADATSAALAINSLKHQIVTNTGIAAVTDVVVSQPTRRYSVGVNYKATAAADNTVALAATSAIASAIYRTASVANNSTAATYYTGVNTSLVGRQVCIDTINAPGQVILGTVGQLYGLLDLEEGTLPSASGSFAISPQNTTAGSTIVNICGEASVLSINQGGVAAASSAVSATVARSDLTTPASFPVIDGWASWNFTNGVLGYPVLGSTFVRMRNGTVNYGVAYPHKTN